LGKGQRHAVIHTEILAPLPGLLLEQFIQKVTVKTNKDRLDVFNFDQIKPKCLAKKRIEHASFPGSGSGIAVSR
jgi:hypothetical protein